MKTQYLAQPIMSTDKKLLGVEVLTRFMKDGLNLLRPTPTEIMLGWTIHEKRAYLIDVIHFITNNEEFFIGNKLFCSLSIDSSTALILKHDAYIQILIQSMPYLKLLISEGLSNPVLKSLSHSSNALFLNYHGINNLKTDVSVFFEAVKIDESYFSAQFFRNSFPVLLKDIIKYCPRVIVSGVFDSELLQYLQDWGVWGVQGELYEPVPLQNVSTLL
ncbi:EAL domain-containing protein [Serratia proteamaculans]|uniref:hypothetical protein n=1 Tax=Serratia proteamaculans TaxID=28151 RepID=UPI00217BB0EC|nr:hypothetical protein [Serratia proteamaculans]CAI1738320.1 Cyclic di-GMP phosphodiesterase YhjH [Serratia proteamaculans]